jgi:hypothetical protein
LGTPYPCIVADVAEMMERFPLPGGTLAVDGTGVGAAVVGQFRAARVPCRLVPVVITAGRAVSWVRGELHAAKMQLTSVLQKLLGEQRLKVAPIPDHRETLEQELRNFSVKVSADSGALTYQPSARATTTTWCSPSPAPSSWPNARHGRCRPFRSWWASLTLAALDALVLVLALVLMLRD